MESDRFRWNEKHAAKTGSGDPDVFFLKHADSLILGQTLDLACGRGRHALYLATLGHKVTAADISDVALDYLQKRAVGNGIELQIVQADLDQPENLFAEQRFDNIVCINFRPSDKLLAHLPAWLKPGGKFLWCSFNEIQAALTGFPLTLALHQNAFVNLPGLSCLVYQRFEDHTGHRDGYLFVKK